jgi:hypothetical protein
MWMDGGNKSWSLSLARSLTRLHQSLGPSQTLCKHERRSLRIEGRKEKQARDPRRRGKKWKRNIFSILKLHNNRVKICSKRSWDGIWRLPSSSRARLSIARTRFLLFVFLRLFWRGWISRHCHSGGGEEGERRAEKFLISHLHTMRQLPRRDPCNSTTNDNDDDDRLRVKNFLSFAFFCAIFMLDLHFSRHLKKGEGLIAAQILFRRHSQSTPKRSSSSPPRRLCLYIRGGSHYLTKQQKRWANIFFFS